MLRYKAQTLLIELVLTSHMNIFGFRDNITTYIPMEDDLGVAPWLDMLYNAL